MSINIKGEGVKIWRRNVKTNDGREFAFYTVSSSTKNQDGTYSNAYTDVKFSKKSGAPDQISNGATCDFEGFLTAGKRRDKHGDEYYAPVIMITKVDFGDTADSFEQMEEDIPF